MCNQKTRCYPFLVEALFLLFMVSAGCAAHGWKEAKFSGGLLCLRPDLDWKESRIEELVGSYLREVYTSYPYKTSVGEARVLDISISHVKQGNNPIQPPKEADYMADTSHGLLVWRASNDDEYFKSPRGEFDARCPNTRYQVCYRRFQTDLIVGYYVFPRDTLKEWKEWEEGLTAFLIEGIVRQCTDTPANNVK